MGKNLLRNGYTSWGLKNPVTINLVMFLVILLGIVAGFKLNREMFPKFDLDIVQVSVVMEGGSTPDQVDRNIVQLIQPLIQNLDGVKKVTSRAFNNSARILVEVQRGYDTATVRQKIKDKVDTIQDFPEEALEPLVEALDEFEQAMKVAIYGSGQSPWNLRLAAQDLKDQLVTDDIAARVTLYDPFPFELKIEAPLTVLQAKGLTLQSLAQQIRNSNLELTGGVVRTETGNIILKGDSRKTTAEALRKLPITFPDGEWVYLQDLVGMENIVDGFQEDHSILRFNGEPAAILEIRRQDNEDLLDLSHSVRSYLEKVDLPAGIQVDVFEDFSIPVRDRLTLIGKNAVIGLILVVIVLGLFLEWRVAFWTAVGIAFALVGSLAIIYAGGGSLNMISLFGFLLASGIVVDDAIVVAESFFHCRQMGLKPWAAANQAVTSIYKPVLAMMSTTAVAFLPLLFIPGMMGKFIAILPVVVIAAVFLSLFESLIILPVHLAHHCGEKDSMPMKVAGKLLFPIVWVSRRIQPILDGALEKSSHRLLKPSLNFCLKHRYSTVLFFAAILIFLFGLIPAGIVKTALFPNVDADLHLVTLKFEAGTAPRQMTPAVEELLAGLEETNKLYTQPGGLPPVEESFLRATATGEATTTMFVRLRSPDEGRLVSGQEFIDTWRSQLNLPPRVEAVEFASASGGPQAKAIEVQLTGTDDQALEYAESLTRGYLETLDGVVDIQSSSRSGSPVVSIRLKKEFYNSSITEAQLMATLAAAYQGVKLDTFFRKDNQVKTYLRAPQIDRTSLRDLEQIQLPGGLYVGQVANLKLGTEPAMVKRVDGDKTITVQADVDLSSGANAQDLRSELESNFLEYLPDYVPEVRWSYSGEAEEGGEAVDAMIINFIPTIFAMYLILATLFRSYLQPIIIMTAIPLSLVGVIIGHILMGLPLNLLSSFGIIGLMGIAVNDSLVLVSTTNDFVEEGMTLREALVVAAQRRLRPILLTSITTIVCMSPILLETSFQAQFLIPMVNSIVFGLAAASLLILLLIPVGYLILIDSVRYFHYWVHKEWVPEENLIRNSHEEE